MRTPRGFTLIELMVVVALVAIAAGTVALSHVLASMLVWPLVGLGLATLAFRRVTP